MGLARVWFLLSLAFLALLLGSAATSVAPSDPIAEIAAAQAADREGRYLKAKVEAALAAHRQAAEAVAGDPRLSKVFALTDVPPEALRSFMDGALKAVMADQPRYRAALVGPGAVILASTLQGDAGAAAGHGAVAQALKGEAASGRLAGDEWLAAAPVRSGDGAIIAALALVADGPVALITAAHEKDQFDSALLIFEGEQVAGGVGPEPVRAAMSAPALTPPAATDPVALEISGARYATRRFELVDSVAFALAWPQPVTEAPGVTLGGLMSQISFDGPLTLTALGIAVALWILGFALGFVPQRAGVQRLKSALSDVAESPAVVDVGAPRMPGWIRPVATAAQEALDAVRGRAQAPEGAIESAGSPAVDTQALEDERRKTAALKEEIRTLESTVSSLRSELSAARKTAAKAIHARDMDDSSMAMEVALETGVNMQAIRPEAPDLMKRDIVLPAAEEDAIDEAESTADKEIDPELRDASIPGAPLPPELLSEGVAQSLRGAKSPQVPLPEPPPSHEPLFGSISHVPEDPEDEAERTAQGPGGRALINAPTDHTAIGPPPEMPESRPDEGHFRTTYDEFLETRRACGESTHLTYEKFRRKLMATRNQLFERFECEDVRFKVYVKSGKASLKATPVFNKRAG